MWTVTSSYLNDPSYHHLIYCLSTYCLPLNIIFLCQSSHEIPDLASIITWMPHGRSWKILNRELFASFALPRYFGHSNHASFVRIVNAW